MFRDYLDLLMTVCMCGTGRVQGPSLPVHSVKPGAGQGDAHHVPGGYAGDDGGGDVRAVHLHGLKGHDANKVEGPGPSCAIVFLRRR